MPFREKSAWIALLAMAACYGAYFFAVTKWPQGTGGRASFRFLGFFALATVSQLVIMVVAHIAIALTSRADAKAPADERDRAIDGRARGIAYYVLMTGTVIVGCVMPFNSGGWRIINAALLALVAAEMVRYGTVILSYRRGWNG
jgi:hypothetical protein